MKPFKTIEMKLVKTKADTLIFCTHSDILNLDAICLCYSTLREYFEIPKTTKIIWLQLFSQYVTDSVKIEPYSKITRRILVDGEMEYDLDIHLYQLLEQCCPIYVKVQYE